MLRLTNIINVGLALGCIAILYTLVQVKSQIAVEERQIYALSQNLDDEVARQEALQAEWARLQQRRNILALGEARFGAGISEVAEEAHIRDIPLHPQRNDLEGEGRNQALAMFHRAVAEMTAREARLAEQDPTLAPTLLDPDPIARLIAEDLRAAEAEGQ